MSIESLKKKARRHEQDEQWQGALDQYKKALAELARDEPETDDGYVDLLAQAYEALEDKDSAVEYYDRAFALDINFADVTERPRELR